MVRIQTQVKHVRTLRYPLPGVLNAAVLATLKLKPQLAQRPVQSLFHSANWKNKWSNNSVHESANIWETMEDFVFPDDNINIFDYKHRLNMELDL